MARGCGCAGESCGCRVTAGTAVTVSGNGSKASPFVISINQAEFPLDAAVKISDSSTIDFTLTGRGTPGDPLVISGSVLLRAPNGARYSLQVSNTGVLSAVAVA